MGVLVILAQKIRVVAANERKVDSRTPMLPERLRIFASNPRAISILPDCHFERDVPVCVDCIATAAQYCFTEPSIRRELGRQCTVPRNRLPSVPSYKKPFPGLAFQLENIKRVFVGSVVRCTEMSCLRFQCEPPEGNCDIATSHDHFWIKPLDTDINTAGRKSRYRIKGGQIIESFVEGQLILNGSGMIPTNTSLWTARENSSGIV
jgi:hypothetical protein